ncbi:pyridoxal phosphate (PLP)-dependent transferases superfamily protein isoform X2 [Wolffia australiana]
MSWTTRSTLQRRPSGSSHISARLNREPCCLRTIKCTNIYLSSALSLSLKRRRVNLPGEKLGIMMAASGGALARKMGLRKKETGQLVKFVCQTRVPRNLNMEKLQSGYLFPEIAIRQKAFMQRHPEAQIISLGIGDTTLPIPRIVSSAMAQTSHELSTPDGYRGYGAEQGNMALRKKITEVIYKDMGIKQTEVFVSDGAQSDISRIQMMMGSDVTIAVQDPTFPAYVDSGVIMGQSTSFTKETGGYGGIEYMRCSPEKLFFPDLSTACRTDVIFLCSPNNPTGHAASRSQLEQLVSFAKRNGSIIVYDSAYSSFISDNSPKSIYEIDGAKEVAIEVSSFSKFAGFTGIRLGWTVVPEELVFSDGSSVRSDFDRIVCTCFNGASSIAQSGGIACLSTEGLTAINKNISVYAQNAMMLGETFAAAGLKAYGGRNSPYVWVHFPGRRSWEVFEEILEKTNIVTIPGTGFGPGGESFVRVSAFALQETVQEACRRLRRHFARRPVKAHSRDCGVKEETTAPKCTTALFPRG